MAILSGLTDMDAITLSTAHMMNAGEVASETGWRLIVSASLANLGFKLTAIGLAGPRRCSAGSPSASGGRRRRPAAAFPVAALIPRFPPTEGEP